MWSLEKIFDDVSNNNFDPNDIVIIIKEISRHIKEATSDDLIYVMCKLALAYFI